MQDFEYITDDTDVVIKGKAYAALGMATVTFSIRKPISRDDIAQDDTYSDRTAEDDCSAIRDAANSVYERHSDNTANISFSYGRKQEPEVKLGELKIAYLPELLTELYLNGILTQDDVVGISREAGLDSSTGLDLSKRNPEPRRTPRAKDSVSPARSAQRGTMQNFEYLADDTDVVIKGKVYPAANMATLIFSMRKPVTDKAAQAAGESTERSIASQQGVIMGAVETVYKRHSDTVTVGYSVEIGRGKDPQIKIPALKIDYIGEILDELRSNGVLTQNDVAGIKRESGLDQSRGTSEQIGM